MRSARKRDKPAASPGAGTSLLRAHELAKSFPGADEPVVAGLSFALERGEILVLVGPSGCGKTTTLRMLAGLEAPDAGTIRLGDRLLDGPGTHVPPERRRIGLVFQDYALFPHLTVWQNVAFGLRSLPRRERARRTARALRLADLEGFDARRPHDLSGGQQQRVAVARAIAPAPEVLLLDEPFSNLDADLRRGTRQQIRELVRELGMGAVLVTHDQDEALAMGDRIAVLAHGRIQQAGSPEEVYRAPETACSARFLGATNLLAVEASGLAGDSPIGALPLSVATTGPATVSLRPEHLRLRAPADAPDRPPGKVVSREFKGHDATYRVRVGETECLVQTGPECAFREGDAVALEPVADAAVLHGRDCGDSPEASIGAAPSNGAAGGESRIEAGRAGSA